MPDVDELTARNVQLERDNARLTTLLDEARTTINDLRADKAAIRTDIVAIRAGKAPPNVR